MELIITKNGHVYARATDAEAAESDVYALQTVQDVPEYPGTAAGRGKAWELDYVDGALQWVAIDRPLTQEERLEKVESDMEALQNPWTVGETVQAGDRRYYKGKWYICVQGHTTQADWTPDLVPALWREEG